MREVSVKELQKGDLIVCRWMDASEFRARAGQHDSPEVYVKDWGVFLGVSGIKRKHIIIGKDVVETWNDWGATRIPLELVESITLVLDRDEMANALQEIKALTRKVHLRKYKRLEMT